MSFYKYILAGLTVALFSLGYNYIIFDWLNFYPDDAFVPPIFIDFGLSSFYIFLFITRFLVGMLLMYLFAHGAHAMESDSAKVIDDVKTVFFFASYALVSLIVFTFGDFVLMGSPERLFFLVTVDSFMEMMIAMIPIRIFYVTWLKKGKKVDI